MIDRKNDVFFVCIDVPGRSGYTRGTTETGLTDVDRNEEIVPNDHVYTPAGGLQGLQVPCDELSLHQECNRTGSIKDKYPR